MLMKKLIWVSFLVLFSTNAFANIGSRPFHSTGWIGNDYTLHPVAELKADSVNLLLESGSGNLKYKGTAEYDIKHAGLAISGSSKLESGIVGYGYANAKTEAESNILDSETGFQDKQETTQTTYGAGYLHLTDQLNYYGGIFRSSYNYERTYSLNSSYYWTSTGTSTKSDSVTVEVNRFQVGALFKSSEEISFGGIFTPASGGKGEIEDPETEIYYGNGDQIRVGLGYHIKNLSIGIDIVNETENKAYLVNASSGLLVDAYFLLQPDVSIKGIFNQRQTSELTKDGTSYPSSNITDIGVGIRIAKDQMFFGADYLQESISYDGREEDDRESGTASSIKLAATFQF